ncbi:MAG: TIGR03663 family protein [Chloroflexi bacterium]|nr:TIGR03663 family protein [Chloroflexota bacterium]
MAVIPAAPAPAAYQEDRPLPPRPTRWRITLDGEQLLYLLLLAVAAALRFWDLGSRALHHDESLHAVYSWYLYVGRGYLHDPMMHGPFQFHATALIYFLFGDSDTTARVLPALFGTALVGLPYFLRSQLGRTGALATAALLTFSPVLLYYSRFLRNDIYSAVWHMTLVICLWRYLESAARRYLYLAAAALALAFATKEVAYLTVAIFGAYLLLTTLPEVLPRLARGLHLKGLSPRAEFLVLLGTLTLPLGAAAVLLVWHALGLTPPPAAPSVERTLLVAGSVGGLALLGAALGLRWSPRAWLISAAVFFSIYATLYTTFFTNPPGFVSGIWGSLEYWMAQQDVRRGGQPWFYYLVLLPLYEFLPLAVVGTAAAVKLRRDPLSLALTLVAIVGAGAAFAQHDGGGLAATTGLPGPVALVVPAAVALGAAVALMLRRWEGLGSFTGFLVFWLAGSVLAYSYAGEKMPWLSVHLVLPLILLAGMSLGRLLERMAWRAAWRDGSMLVVPALLLTPLAVGALLARSAALSPSWTSVGPAALLALGALLSYAFLDLTRRSGLRRLAALGALAGLLVLAAFTVRTAWQAAYYHGDIPVEMLVYTQTSPEVPKILRDIDEVARLSGQGKDLPITVDAQDGFTWPWHWYLRDYTRVDYPTLNAPSGPPAGSVLLLAAANEAANRPYLSKYGSGRRFPHRWWFPEDGYRGATVPGLAAGLTDPGTLRTWWRYVLYRELPTSLGSADALVYLPKDLGGATLFSAPSAPVDAYASLARDLPVAGAIAGRGREAGAFEGPRGLAVDREGNLYVADALNHRVLKFDPTGQFLAQVGQYGTGEGEFREPWGLAVDREGNLYVADTWNHRIQQFDAQLRLVAAWGEFANVTGPPTSSPGLFFGPRAIAIDGDGNLWVTDTGNKRVQKFAPDGRALAVFGGAGTGPGRFAEPVGIAIAPNGDILVADTWNRRVQRFDRNFTFLSEFPVRAWPGEGILNKPYLAVEPGGAILVTDPEYHRVLRFSPQGVPLAALGRFGTGPAEVQLPIGVAVDERGQVYLADAGNHRVLRLDALREG